MRTKNFRFAKWAGSGLLLGLLALSGCDNLLVTDPASPELFKLNDVPVTLSNAEGQTAATFYHYETVFVNAEKLQRCEQYCVQIAEKGKEAFGGAIVLSDSLGRIVDLPMWFDIGFEAQRGLRDVSGEYEVRVTGHNHSPFIRYVRPFQVASGVNTNKPFIIGTNDTGLYNGGSLVTNADLFANGLNFPASTEVHIYVVDDKDGFMPGEALVDISGSFETVTTNASGELPNTKIWPMCPAAAGTTYDIIGDLPPYGQFDATDAVRESRLKGVLVQRPPAATDIITQLATDVYGNFQDYFNQDEIIAVKAIPPQQTLLPSADAAVYIVNHQEVWKAGDRLVNTTNICDQEMSSFERLRFVPAYKHLFSIFYPGEPAAFKHLHRGLHPGKYDVVIDVGRNFVYDPGVDILDGGTQVGFKMQNCLPFMPKIRTYASTDIDFMPPNNSTNVYAKAIYADDSPVIGAQVTFKIIEGSGTLSHESGVTDETGVAVTKFTEGVAGEYVKIKIKILTPCGCRFEHLITIWFKIPGHDQGVIIGGN